MAIAVDAVSTGSQDSGVSFTWSHTCTGSNLLLLVSVVVPSAVTITSVTYNAVSMTSVGSADNASGGKVQIFRLINPATGANSVVVTPDHNGPAAAGAISFTGVDQTTPLGTPATATGNSATPSVSVTSATGEMAYDSIVSTTGGLVYTAGAGQTERHAANNPAFDVRLRSSTEAGAATVVMDWSVTGAFQWASIGVSVMPSAGTATQLREVYPIQQPYPRRYEVIGY